MLRMSYTQRDAGPIFTRQADLAARRYCEELEDDVADFAVSELHKEFDKHFKHPTGYYKSQVRVRKQGEDSIVGDGGVVYGPWLEGVGSRNFPVTRFKGYSSFRRVFRRVEERSMRMADRLLRTKWIRRMG